MPTPQSEGCSAGGGGEERMKEEGGRRGKRGEGGKRGGKRLEGGKRGGKRGEGLSAEHLDCTCNSPRLYRKHHTWCILLRIRGHV